MKGRIRIFALGIIASLLFCLVPMFASEYSTMRFSGIHGPNGRMAAQNDTNTFKYKSGVKIEQTIEMKVGGTTILDPWAVVSSKYFGFSCAATDIWMISDLSAVSVSERSRTSTIYPNPYQNTGGISGYYSTYDAKALKAGTYYVILYVFCTKRQATGGVIGDFFVKYKLVVTENPKVVSISIPSSLSLSVGESYTFKPVILEEGASTTLTWTSSNPSVVSTNGSTIHANAQGNARITCTASNGVSASCTVNVSSVPVSHLSIEPSEIELEADGTAALAVNIWPLNATNQEVEWKSSNTQVASVDTYGMVKGRSEGDCVVTATTCDGSNISASCAVRVNSQIIVTAKDVTREYGNENPQFEYTVEGGMLDGEPEISCSAGIMSATGDYEIQVTRGSVTNKNVTFVPATLTVSKAPLTVTARSYTRREYEINPTLELDYEGFKNGEDESVLQTLPRASCDATALYPPGVYPIIVSGGKAENYEIIRVNGTLTIVALVCGDVNMDGAVNVSDIEKLSEHVLKKHKARDYPQADVNGDGIIDVTDIVKTAAIILKVILWNNNLITSLPL